MGHFCWICGRTRANEHFSGRGHRRNECRACQSRVGSEQRARMQAHLDLYAFLSQENVSARNLAFAERWIRDGDAEMRALAEIVAEVARLHPRKRKRRAFLVRNHPDLWARMVAAGVADVPEPSLSGDPYEDGSSDDPDEAEGRFIGEHAGEDLWLALESDF